MMNTLFSLTHPFCQPLCRQFNRLFVSQCLLCNATLDGELLCAGCQCDLPYLHDKDLCKQCGLTVNNGDSYCGHCLKSPPAFSSTLTPFAYQFPLDRLIHQFKYRKNLTCGKLLSTLVADHIRQYFEDNPTCAKPELLIPTPTHWTKRWQRGFNQAEILAQYLAKALDIPLTTRAVKRIAKTPAQKELTRKERQHNLRRAFYIAPSAAKQLQGKRVAIIDDVITTTTTVRELSRALAAAGVSEIQVWGIARTM